MKQPVQTGSEITRRQDLEWIHNVSYSPSFPEQEWLQDISSSPSFPDGNSNLVSPPAGINTPRRHSLDGSNPTDVMGGNPTRSKCFALAQPLPRAKNENYQGRYPPVNGNLPIEEVLVKVSTFQWLNFK